MENDKPIAWMIEAQIVDGGSWSVWELHTTEYTANAQVENSTMHSGKTWQRVVPLYRARVTGSSSERERTERLEMRLADAETEEGMQRLWARDLAERVKVLEEALRKIAGKDADDPMHAIEAVNIAREVLSRGCAEEPDNDMNIAWSIGEEP